MSYECPDWPIDCEVHTPRRSPFQASDLPYVVINDSTHFEVRDRSKGEIHCTHGDWTGTLRQNGKVQFLVVNATGHEIEVQSVVPTAAKTIYEYKAELARTQKGT